jgi:hypothetical protein
VLAASDTGSSTANTVVHISAHFALSRCVQEVPGSSGSCPTGCGSRSHQKWVGPSRPSVALCDFVCRLFRPTNRALQIHFGTRPTAQCADSRSICVGYFTNYCRRILVGADHLYYCGFWPLFSAAELPTALSVEQLSRLFVAIGPDADKTCTSRRTLIFLGPDPIIRLRCGTKDSRTCALRLTTFDE